MFCLWNKRTVSMFARTYTHIIGALTHLGVLVWGKSYLIHGHYFYMISLISWEYFIFKDFDKSWFSVVNIYNIDFQGVSKKVIRCIWFLEWRREIKLSKLVTHHKYWHLPYQLIANSLWVQVWISFVFVLFSERKESVFKMLIKSYLIFSSLSKFKKSFKCFINCILSLSLYNILTSL